MLVDSYFRRHNYLRISVTDKCNLRCKYCMPPEGVELLSHEQILRNEEFVYLIKIFVSMGIKKIRFTGGEPFIRKGFIDIITKTRELFPDIELCVTTNGTLLNNFINDLYTLRIKKLNISLDTLSRKRYEALTKKDYFNDVLSNIERVIGTNFFDVKINAVLYKETLEELDDFLEYFKDKGATLRFIEKMPFTADDEDDKSEPFLPSDALIEALKSKGKLKRNKTIDTNVSLMYDFIYKNKYFIKIGIIPPMSHKFCSSCNRLRLTSYGSLKTCLHSSIDYDLKGPLRNEIDDDAMRDLIINAVHQKTESHDLDCCLEDGGCHSLVKSGSMSKIGG